MKIKLICGFRKDQEYSVEGEEAHKAYYLFLNPEARSVFNSGLAIKGSDIQRIEPDYQGSMGWNSSHVLDSDDWNEIRNKKLDVKLRDLLATAKELASVATPKSLSLPLSEAREELKLLT